VTQISGSSEPLIRPCKPAPLSRHLMAIVPMVGRGMQNKEIAWELGLTENTVKQYVWEIFKKLGYSGGGSRIKLAAFAWEMAKDLAERKRILDLTRNAQIAT
jgi:DNA-binding NarL/FixJ family response regulator